MQPRSKEEVIAELARKLQACQTEQRPGAGLRIPSGVAGLDRLLPGGGFRAGTLVEWISDEAGTGAWSLALWSAREASRSGGLLVLIDDRAEFYPPAAARMGLPLDRLWIVRPTPSPSLSATGPRKVEGPSRSMPHSATRTLPSCSTDAVWALEQSLRCRGVAVTIAWLARAPDRILRRLQLSAESGGGLGFLLRPREVLSGPVWSDIRLRVTPHPAPGRSQGRRLHVDLLHGRGLSGAAGLELECDDETGVVHSVLQPAESALPRPARA